MVTRIQHYVWKHYLKAWQQLNGFVHCLRQGKVFSSNPKNLMVERDFYALKTISRTDVAFILAFFMKSNPHLLRINWNLLVEWATIANMNEVLQKEENVLPSDKSYMRQVVIESMEKFHANIESGFVPILQELRNQKTRFMTSDMTAIQFFHFVAHQYFRTKLMRNRISDGLRRENNGQDFSHLTNTMCAFFANNLGGTLFVDRSDFSINFLNAPNGTSFITGDQPIVNLLATGDDTPPKELALYYPISPKLAVLLAPKRCQTSFRIVTLEVMENLNSHIGWNSSEFLVSYSKDTLTQIATSGSACFGNRPTYDFFSS